MPTTEFLTKTYGGISHSLCIAYFCSLKYTVSMPLFDNARYDLLVDFGDSIKRVQCKTAKIYKDSKNPHYNRVRLGHGSQKCYKPTDFDLLWIITNEFAYLIPMSDIPITDNEEVVGISLSPKYNTFIVDIPFLSQKDPQRRLTTIPLSENEKKRIEQLYLSGESLKSTAMLMGLKESQVESYLYTHSIRKNHFITPEIENKILEMYKSGTLVAEIVKETGFTRAAIQKVVKGSGIPRRAPRINPEWKPQIIEMYKSGKGPLEISARFGIKRQAIASFIHRQKWLVDMPTS